jgi:hypothetical protein
VEDRHVMICKNKENNDLTLLFVTVAGQLGGKQK